MSKILDKFSLEGRTALVTGGAGLLGRQFTRTLGEAGAKVVVADLDQKAADEQAQALVRDGIEALDVVVDVTDPESVAAMVTTTVAKFGSLDVIVNSAALDPKFDKENLDQQSANAFETYPLETFRVPGSSSIFVPFMGWPGRTSGCMSSRTAPSSLNRRITRSAKPVSAA